MTVTSVPAPVAPTEAASSDQPTTAGDTGAAGTGFASLLAGLNGRGTPTAGAKTGDRNAPGGAKAGTANTPADPVTLALLGALAGIAANDPTADPAAPPTATDATPPTAAPASPAAPGVATPELATAELRPLTDAALSTPALVAQASAPAPDVAGSATNAPPATAAAAVSPLATAPPNRLDAKPTDDTASDSGAAEATVPASTSKSHTLAPAAAVATASPVATATDTTAATAGATPIVRSDPASKSDTIAENVMITAATAAADHAPPAPATTAATAAPTPAAPLPPPPAEQLVAVMRPLHRGPDGTYQLRIEMRPPELGRVDLRVEMRDGVLHASIHAEHAETAELVRSALDDLRARLDADGMRSGQLTVDAHGAGTPGRDRQAPAAQRPADAASGTAEPTATTPTTTTPSVASDSLLDVRI